MSCEQLKSLKIDDKLGPYLFVYVTDIDFFFDNFILIYLSIEK